MQANEANVRGGFAAMTMESVGNLSFIVPELISKGYDSLDALHAAACTAPDKGESLIHKFKLFQSSKSKPKGLNSYLARLQNAIDESVKSRDRQRLGTSQSSRADTAKSRRGT